MDIYQWYLIFNTYKFQTLNLVSKTYNYEFDQRGLVSLLVTKANTFSVLVDDIFLTVKMNDKNPSVKENRALFYDEKTGDVYLGYKVEQ